MHTTSLRQTQTSYKKPFAIIVGIIIAVIILLVFISVGRVTITVSKKYDSLPVDFNAEVVPKNEAKGDKIPGRVMSTVISGTEKITEIDKKEVDKPATGKVIIHNKLDHNQPLIATTRLLTEDGTLFRLKNRVDLKAHSTVEAEIYADQPGSSGEIEPTKFTVPGIWQEWQDKIYAESTEPTSGGFGEADFISEETLTKGTEQAIEKIKESGKQQLQQQLTSNEKVLDEAIDIEILSSTASAQADTLASEFSVTAEIRLTTVVFDEDKLFELAENKLKEQIPSNVTTESIPRESLSYTLELFDLEKQTATLATHLEAQTVSDLDPSLIEKGKLIGRTEEEVIDYLNRKQDIGEVEVKFSPSWLKTIPANEEKIEVKFKD